MRGGGDLFYVMSSRNNNPRLQVTQEKLDRCFELAQFFTVPRGGRNEVAKGEEFVATRKWRIGTAVRAPYLRRNLNDRFISILKNWNLQSRGRGLELLVELKSNQNLDQI